MKSFAQYLTESERTYSYRIKIVGDVTDEFFSEFKTHLKKFDPVKINDSKKTPIISQPLDFPGVHNQHVNIIDVEFRYPATPPQIEQIARLLGLEESRLIIKTLNWAEGVDQELMGIDAQSETLLTSEYPASTDDQKKAKEQYSANAEDKEVVRNSARKATWEIAGGKTPPAVTTTHLLPGTSSPMTRINRPPKPATGRNK